MAQAQTPLKPWPDQQPQHPQQQQRAWPGDAPQQTSAPAGPLGPVAAPPMMGMPQQMQQPRQAEPSSDNPCVVEFTKMRGEVEKKGHVAKAVNDRKGTREEMCSAIAGIHQAQVNWVKWTVAHSKQCGIPPDIIKQLRLGQDNLNKMRKGVCSGGPAGGASAAMATPSLSEALGTAGLPPTAANDNAPRKRGGVLDNLTGTPIR
jgi:hypothetical protein